MVYSIGDIETIRRVIRDTSKLELADLAELMQDAPPEVIEYMKSLRKRASVRQRGLTKKRRESAAKRIKNEANTPTTRKNSFGMWLRDIEKSARGYLDRVSKRLHKFEILDTRAAAPWALELELNSSLPDELSLYTDQPDKLTELYSKYFGMFTAGTRSIFDLKLKTFAQELDCGAILTCMHTHLIDTKRMTVEELVKTAGISKSTSERMRHAYALVRKYNMLLYSGSSYNELYKWRKELTAHLDDNPAEAYWWQGGGVEYGDNLPSPSFNPDVNLAFDTHTYVFSLQNTQDRAANLEKMNADPKGLKKRELGDEGNDDESCDLCTEDELDEAVEKMGIGGGTMTQW